MGLSRTIPRIEELADRMLDQLIPHADMKPDDVSMNSAKRSSLMKNGKSHTNTAKYGSQAEMV